MNRLDYVGLTFSLVCVAFCHVGFSRIQSNTEDVLQWLPDQSEAREKYDFFTSKFGSDDFLIVTWEGCTVDDPRLKSFTQHIRDHDSEALIQTVTNGTEVFHRLSDDLKLPRANVLRRLRGVFFGTENPELTSALIELSRRGTANRGGSMQLVWDAIDAEPDLRRDDVAIGGYPYIATFIDRQLNNSFRNFLVPSVALSTLIALICLRNFVLTMIVFLTAVGSAATSIAFIPLCDTKYGGLMSIIPALVFVLATSGSIHLIRYSLGAIGDPIKLLKIGWRPCAVSAATTSVGMLSLLRSDFPAIRNFGLFCATGVGFALAFQLVLVPWLLGRFGAVGLNRLAMRSERSSFWFSLVDQVRSHRKSVALSCVLIMALGGVGLMWLDAEVEVEKLFRPDSEILTSITNLESRLGPMDQTELLVVFDQPDPESFPDRAILVRRIQLAVSKLPEVNVIYSLVNFLPTEPTKATATSFMKRSAYRSLLRRERENLSNGNLLHIDGHSETWRVSLRFPFTEKRDFDKLKRDVIEVSSSVVKSQRPAGPSVGSTEIEVAESANEAGATKVSDAENPTLAPAPSQLVYSGKTHLFHHAQLNLLTDLFQNFLLAFLIITPMLVIVLRSFSLGLIAMLPNVFPTLMVFGGLGWAGFPIDLAIAMTACVALGIAVDDTTHFLIRFRDFGGGFGNVVDPVRTTMSQCGPAMLHTTLIGAAGLFVYYFSDMLVVSRFAWAIATLLVIALLADVLMLPAILFLLVRSESDGVDEPVGSGPG